MVYHESFVFQSDFAGITAVLSNWCLTCDAMLSSIEYQVTHIISILCIMQMGVR